MPTALRRFGAHDARQPAAPVVRRDGLLLISVLRRIGLVHTPFARTSCGTIRLKLLKIGALVRTSVRRIKLAMPSIFPDQAEYRVAYAALTGAATA